jgi:hypothetical protein
LLLLFLIALTLESYPLGAPPITSGDSDRLPAGSSQVGPSLTPHSDGRTHVGNPWLMKGRRRAQGGAHPTLDRVPAPQAAAAGSIVFTPSSTRQAAKTSPNCRYLCSGRAGLFLRIGCGLDAAGEWRKHELYSRACLMMPADQDASAERIQCMRSSAGRLLGVTAFLDRGDMCDDDGGETMRSSTGAPRLSPSLACRAKGPAYTCPTGLAPVLAPARHGRQMAVFFPREAAEGRLPTQESWRRLARGGLHSSQALVIRTSCPADAHGPAIKWRWPPRLRVLSHRVSLATTILPIFISRSNSLNRTLGHH